VPGANLPRAPRRESFRFVWQTRRPENSESVTLGREGAERYASIILQKGKLLESRSPKTYECLMSSSSTRAKRMVVDCADLN